MVVRIISAWAEWSLTDQPTRRVGIVHASANGIATAIYVASWVARVKGRQDVGILLGRTGAIFLLVSGTGQAELHRCSCPPCG